MRSSRTVPMARATCLVALYRNSVTTIADMDDRRFGKTSITQLHWLGEVEFEDHRSNATRCKSRKSSHVAMQQSCQAQPNYYAPNSSQLGGMQRSQVD